MVLTAFGSLLAAALPLITAGFALITGVIVMGLLSKVITMPDFTTVLGSSVATAQIFPRALPAGRLHQRPLSTLRHKVIPGASQL